MSGIGRCIAGVGYRPIEEQREYAEKCVEVLVATPSEKCADVPAEVTGWKCKYEPYNPRDPLSGALSIDERVQTVRSQYLGYLLDHFEAHYDGFKEWKKENPEGTQAQYVEGSFHDFSLRYGEDITKPAMRVTAADERLKELYAKANPRLIAMIHMVHDLFPRDCFFKMYEKLLKKGTFLKVEQRTLNHLKGVFGHGLGHPKKEYGSWLLNTLRPHLFRKA
jgi:hypothetical protein